MATIKDIAIAAGVSVGTVDRIIHKRGRFSPLTALKVKKIMEDLNYTPNIHARGLKKTRLHHFAAIIPKASQDSGYWALVTEGIEKGALELSSFGTSLTIYHYDRFSLASCKAVFEEVAQKEYEGLLIAPTFHEEVTCFLSKNDIPVMFIDSDIEGIKQKVSYMGQDSYQSGVLSAKLMSMLLRGVQNPNIMIVHPPGENIHHRERIKGFSTLISSTTEQVHLFEVPGGILPRVDMGKELFSKIDGIFVANSYVYEVAAILDELGDGFTDISLIGYDYIPSGKRLITAGVINFIITQEPKSQGYQGALTLYDSIVLSREVKEVIHIPLTIIMSENLEEYIHYT